MTLYVYGSNFVAASIVQLNGSARTTNYVSAHQLTAAITSADLEAPISYSVTVSNGTTATTSAASTLTVLPPTITSTTPASVIAGGPAFTLTVAGRAFLPTSIVESNDRPQATTYVSSTELTAQMTAEDISSGRLDAIMVSNGSAENTSSGVCLEVANPVPDISRLSPKTVIADGNSFVLTVFGSGFVNSSNVLSSSTVLVNGIARTTTYVSPTQLTAQLLSTDIINGGNVPITVSNPTPGGGTSNAVSLALSNPVPMLTGINANTAVAGCGAFTIYVMGSNFVKTSVVMWNGSPRTTTQSSPTLLTAQISAADVASAGTASVTVTNPSPGGGNSSAQNFTTTATGGPTTDAVAYQINTGHSGMATTRCPVSLPSSSLWNVNLGAAQSYALIADGLVFATVGGSQLYALNQATGGVIWGPVNAMSNGTAYDSNFLFVAGGQASENGLIEAISAESGAELWTYNTQTPSKFMTGVTALNGFVYTTGYALTESSGAIAWEADTGGTGSDPAVTADGVYNDIEFSEYDVNPSSGASVWLYEPSPFGYGVDGINTMAVANGFAFAPNIIPKETQVTDGWIFNSETGQILSAYTGDNLAAIGSQLGYFVQSGAINGIDLNTNKLIWSDPYITGGAITSPVVVNQTVFVGSQGTLYAFDANTGQQLWEMPIPSGMAPGFSASTNSTFPSTSPSLAAGDGLLVVPSGNSLIAFQISNNP